MSKDMTYICLVCEISSMFSLFHFKKLKELSHVTNLFHSDKYFRSGSRDFEILRLLRGCPCVFLKRTRASGYYSCQRMMYPPGLQCTHICCGQYVGARERLITVYTYTAIRIVRIKSFCLYPHTVLTCLSLAHSGEM